MPMKRDLRDKWVAALRDGTRTQLRRDWKNKEGHQCCLDVLMEVAGVDRDGFDPRTKCKDLGLTDVDAEADVHVPGRLQHFIEMNDRLGNSFAEIADAVEKYVEVV